MKHNLKARTLALALALVMLLPLISIPTFAEETHITSFAASFDGKTLDTATEGTLPVSAQLTTAAKDGDTHGDVLQVDAVPMANADFYIFKDEKNKYPIDSDYDIFERGGNELLSGTANGWEIAGAPVNWTGNSQKTTVNGDSNYAVVTGAWLDARYGSFNVMTPLNVEHPKISGEGDYITISFDMFLSADLTLSAGISGRVYEPSGKRAEIFHLVQTNGTGPIYFQKHGDANNKDGSKKELSVGEWHTFTFIIDRNTALLTAFADGEYVFQSLSDKNNGIGKLVGTANLPLELRANSLQVELTRYSNPDLMNGFFQIDNVSIELGDTPDLTFSHSFDGKTLSDETTTHMSLASIVKPDEDPDGARGDVLQIETAPNSSVAYYLWTNRDNKWPITGTVTDGLLNGTSAKGDIVDAQIPADDADTSKKVTVNGTQYTLVTGNYADMTAGIENYMKPIKFRQPKLDFSGRFYTVSFDLYLSADFKSSGSCGFTGRMLVDGVNGAETRIQLFQIYSDGTTNQVYMRRHGDANQVGGKNTPLERETWYRIDIVIDRVTTRQYALVDGVFAFEVLSNKDGQKPTSALIGTDAIPMIARANELQIENARGTNAANVGGYVQLDNVGVTVGAPAADYNRIAQDFESIAVGSGSHGFETQSSSPATTNTKILNNYGSNAWNIPLSGNNNRAQYLNTPQYSYETGDTLVYEADYFIEADAIGQIQLQLQSFSANVDGTETRKNGTWLDLYQLRFTGNGTVTFMFENRGVGGVDILKKTATFSAGRWNNIALVIDLTLGVYDVYINGNLTFDDVPMYRGIDGTTYRLTNLTVPTSRITVGKTNNTSDPVYSGNFQMDNVRIFTGTLPTMAAENLNVQDFEAFKYSVGKTAGMDFLPSLSTLVTTNGTNTAFRVDMAPDCAADAYSLLLKNGANKRLDAFVWDLEDKTKGTLNGTEIALVQNGELYEYTHTDGNVYCAVSAAIAGAAVGDDNVCQPVKRIHGAFSYKEAKTVMLEADYFIEEGSTGIIESQIEKFYYGGEEKTEGTYMNLYKIYMETGRLDNGLYMNVGEWNNVKVFLDLETGDISVYLNGVFSHAKKQAKAEMVDISFGGELNYSWSLAKVYRQVNLKATPYVGGLLIDNVSIGTELAEGDADLGEKFLSKDAFKSFAADALMEIVDGASIRLKDENTGLRFATRIFESALTEEIGSRLAEGTTVEIGRRGTLIAPETYYNAVDAFTHADLEGLPVSTKYVEVAYGGLYFGGDVGVTLPEGDYMVGSIVNLKKFDRMFAAAAYIELIVDGESYMLYSDVVVRSAKNVAAAALADEAMTWSAEHEAILKSFAGVA